MAKEKKAAQSGSDMTKFYVILAVVGVIGIGAVGYTVGSNTFGTAASEPVEVPGLDDRATLVELAQGVNKGDQSAPFKIVEFADFQCPACGGFALSVKPQVELLLVETGKAEFVFYDFPIVSGHPNAFLAARAGRCANDQGKFWEYHDVLFRNQSAWSPRTDAIDSFLDYGDDVGVDGETFEACLKSDAHADVVTANMRLGYELGVNATPTVMVQGFGQLRRMNDYSYQSILEAMTAMEAAAAEGN